MEKLAKMASANLRIFALVKLAGKEHFVIYVYLCQDVNTEIALEHLSVIVQMDGPVDIVKFVSYK